MVRKSCYCFTYSCRGKLLDSSVVRRHREDDRKSIAQLAQQRSEEAVSQQHSAISDYVAAQTALGQTTGTSNHRSEDPFAPAQTSPLYPSPPLASSNREQVRQTLSALGIIDDKVQAHAKKVVTSLLKLASTTSSGEPSPCQSLLEEAEEMKGQLKLVQLKASPVVVLRDDILGRLNKSIASLKEHKMAWAEGLRRKQEQAKKLAENRSPYNSDHHFRATLETVNPVLQVFFFALIALHVLFSLPRRACGFLLQAYRYSLQLALSVDKTLSQRDQNILANIPEDPRSILGEFHLEGSYIVRAVCPDPKCHAQYNPTFERDSPIPVYPRHCTYRAYPGGGKCRQPLLRPKSFEGTRVNVPIKTFVAFSLKDWVSNVVSRAGSEDKLDQSWAEALRRPDSTLTDIFHGSTLRNFKGPDGNLFAAHGEEGHYVFSLCVDFFNPLGNKQAGKKKSIGIVSLVCLNFPPEERYKPENLFLAGIIPGPSEPPLDTLNHYLSPLVDELLEFWEPGVFISRTHRHPLGRVVRCALVAVVCDLPAARKTAGFAAVKHEYFCSVCQCRKSEEGYVNSPYCDWERRSDSQCREHAEEYRNATDESARLAAFNAHGVRWSDLLRLPYYDPSQFVVVDAMHNLFLGLIQEHCKNILGIKFTRAAYEKVLHVPLDTAWESFRANEQTAVMYLKSQLEGHLDDDREGYIKRFERRHFRALRYIVEALGISVTPPVNSKRKLPTKQELATALVDWRLRQPTDGTPFFSSLAPGHVLSKADIDAIRADISAMVTPSWTTSIPADLGDPSHGKLKADQWRLLGTIYLPASLVKQWGSLPDADPKSRVRRRLLEITMSLLSAVSIATAHSTSTERASLYLAHLQDYVNGVKELFPRYRFRPNHHMAFHIHEYLLMYGPVHSWWCFPFERLIGMLQRIPNNGKNSEYEETIAKAFTRSSNLRGMLHKSHCPPALRNCQSLFERLMDTHTKDLIRPTVFPDSEDIQDSEDATMDPFTVSTTWTGKVTRLDDEIVSCFTRRDPLGPRVSHGVLSSYIHIRGFTVSSRSRHAGNSQIMVQRADAEGHTPSIVKRIVQVEDSGGKVATYLLVCELQQAQVTRDPFAEYSSLRMGLFVETGPLRLIEPSAVRCHFAALDTVWEGQDLRLVISLSRS